MTHSKTNSIWVSDTPYRPFEKVGAFERPDGSELWVDDPALFEDNGRLYMYFGCGIETGIQGVELDPAEQAPVRPGTDCRIPPGDRLGMYRRAVSGQEPGLD